jgi:hypothetical protein
MAKINNPPPGPPKTPMFPWGGPRSVRERLVDPTQFDRKKKSGRKADPRKPPLASTALLDFMGPGDTSEELRLPPPSLPSGHDADEEGFNDRAFLGTVAKRGADVAGQLLERSLARVRATPERLERIKALLGREQQMLALIGELSQLVDLVDRQRREEQRESGY